MPVRKIMSESPATCHADGSCSDAAKVMWDRDCGVVPITDDADQVVGIITDRDICMAVYLQGRLPHQIPLVEVMSSPVYTCKPEDSLEAAEAIMQRYQVRRLPVLDASGQLVGMLSINDLARVAADKKLGKAVDPRLLSQVLASICQHRPRDVDALPS